VEANGLTFAVWDWPGEDPPLLFAHATGFHGRCWDQVVRWFPTRRCLAIEARGHGRSAKPDPPYHWKPFGADMALIAAQLNLTGAIGVGHSMGGYAVTAAAARRPATFSALLLVDPTIRVPDTYGTEPVDASFIRRRRERWSSPVEMFESFRPRPPFDRWQPEVLEDYCNFGLLPNGAGFILACPAAVEASIYECATEAEAGLHSEIPLISVPVTVLRAGFASQLLFGGDPSPTDPHLAERFPCGLDILLPERAHLIPMEAPQLVAEHIAAIE
jgi:lipase